MRFSYYRRARNTRVREGNTRQTRGRQEKKRGRQEGRSRSTRVTYDSYTRSRLGTRILYDSYSIRADSRVYIVHYSYISRVPRVDFGRPSYKPPHKEFYRILKNLTRMPYDSKEPYTTFTRRMCGCYTNFFNGFFPRLRTRTTRQMSAADIPRAVLGNSWKNSYVPRAQTRPTRLPPRVSKTFQEPEKFEFL